MRSRASLSAAGDLPVLLAYAIAITAVHAARPTATYRTLEIGGSVAAVGVVAASYALLSAGAALPLGRIIDRLGPRRFLLGGIGLLGTGTLLSSSVPTVALLAVAQAFMGLGQIAASISVQALTADTHRGDRDRGFARLTVASATGHLTGPIVAGAILESRAVEVRGSSVVFMVAAMLAAVSLLAAWRLDRRPTERSNPVGASAGPGGGSLRGIVGRQGMPQALVASIVVLTAVDLFIAYLPVIGETRGIGPGLVGLLLALRAGAGLVSRMTLPVLIRRAGRRRVLFTAMAAASISMGGLAVSGNVWVLGLLVVIIGFGLGVGSPMTMAWVANRAPEGGRATALSVRMTGNRIGQVAVPAGVGGFAGLFGPAMVFVLVAGSLLAGAVWVRSSPMDPNDP